VPALPLTQVRAAAASALAPQADTDPPVLADIVDSITPPVLLLEWNDPWITTETIAGAAGILQATLNVICIAGRVEPGPGVDALEQMMVLVLGRLAADPATSWPLTQAQAPRRFDWAGIPYLGVRLSFQPQVIGA